jgi:hypothetical protein
MYVEDGREIFDEEMGDEEEGHLTTKGSKKDAKSTKIKTAKKGNDLDSKLLWKYEHPFLPFHFNIKK